MKVACPHCHAAYSIDDRRVPATGLNVRCPKCRNAFPVRKEPSDPVEPGPVPLRPPAPASAPSRPAEAFAAGAVPLPAPSAPYEPEPAPAPQAPAIALPAPDPAPAPERADPFAEGHLPSPAEAADPLPFEPAPRRHPELEEPAPPAGGAGSLPDLATPDPLPLPAAPVARAAEPQAESFTFGEVDFAAASAPDEPAERPPPAASPPPPRAPGAPPAGGGDEDLEMLFGDGAPGAGAAKPSVPGEGASYQVRRRSGKIFGPFDEAQIVGMLSKGELMGNEDASADGGKSWSPIGAVPVFGEALRSVAVEPAEASPGARPAAAAHPGAVFGDRMAVAKVVEGVSAGVRGPLKKFLIPAAALLLVVVLGVGAGFTRLGFFFVRAFRSGDAAKVTALLAEARVALQRAEYQGDRAALDAATRAAAADADSPGAAARHANVVAILELRHGAPAAALEQARRAADHLDADEKGTLPALEARLAVALAAAPGLGTVPHENALEQAASKAAPDPDVVALLARAAHARGDAPRATALFGRLEAMSPGTARGAYGMGLALVAGRDAAGAKAAFEKVLQKVPGHLQARIELAALAEAAGDVAQAEAQLAPVLADGADQRLAPAERARALALRGTLLARAAERAAEADKVLEAAVQADPRLVEARLALARHRLRRGNAQGAVAALEPLAAQAPAVPALAALRIRALAAAGRALDASSLADQALAKTPGDPALLLAKAAALAASGKGPEAAALFRDAAARDPAAFEPRLALGRIALARGDLAQARVELAAAVEKGPREPAAHAVLGELAALEGDPAAAEKAFGAALALDPEYALAEVGMAKLALARGDAAGARARLDRALAVDPRNVEGHFQRGTLLWQARDLPEAERSFQAVVDLQPKHAVALARLGAVKLERGEDVDGALQRLTAATNEDANLAEARLWLGRALLKKGETPSAINAFRRAVALEPSSVHHIQLGLALERSGSPTEAVEEYRAAAAVDPKSAEPLERLGALFATNGRFEDAAAAFEKAIAVEPRASRHRIAFADAKAKLGRHEDAVRIYREVLKHDPAAVQVLYKLARSVHEASGPKAALPLYERAAKEDPANAMPHYYLGYLYKERGDRARASGEFKRFLALKPDADEKRDIEAELDDLGGVR